MRIQILHLQILSNTKVVIKDIIVAHQKIVFLHTLFHDLFQKADSLCYFASIQFAY